MREVDLVSLTPRGKRSILTGDSSVSGPALELKPWPAQLSWLSLSSVKFPLEAFTGSANTLTYLQLSIHNTAQLDQLASLANSLPQLRHLCISYHRHIEPDPAFVPQLVTFVRTLPSLVHLTFGRLYPHHFQYVLPPLLETGQLRSISTYVISHKSPASVQPAPARRLMATWLEHLREFASLPEARRLSFWRMGVQERGEADHRELTREELEAGEERWAGWDAFREEAAKLGVRLELRELLRHKIY